MPRRTRAAGALRLVLGVTACLLVLTLTAGWVVHQNIEHSKGAALDIARQVMAAIQVQPKVIVNEHTVVEQQSDVLKLVVVEKKLTERLRLDNSWLQSTKTLEVEADFTVRVGFDFAKPFVINVNESAKNLRVTLPPAEILSVELGDVRFLQDEDGFWNKLTDADREQALRELRSQVETHVRQSDLPPQAQASAEKRLTALLASDGRTIDFTPAPTPKQ